MRKIHPRAEAKADATALSADFVAFVKGRSAAVAEYRRTRGDTDTDTDTDEGEA